MNRLKMKLNMRNFRKRLYLILGIGLVASNFLFGQKNILPEDSLRIQKIVEIPNTPTDSLYKITSTWLASKYFQHENKINSIKTDKNGKLIVSFSFDFRSGRQWFRTTQVLTVELRDNLARVTIEFPLKYYLADKDKPRERIWNEMGVHEFEKYGKDLKFVRNQWRKNIKSFEDWCSFNFKISEDEERKNAAFL